MDNNNLDSEEMSIQITTNPTLAGESTKLCNEILLVNLLNSKANLKGINDVTFDEQIENLRNACYAEKINKSVSKEQ
jgi:formiminotetrahydrofolate cyclodeaminase